MHGARPVVAVPAWWASVEKPDFLAGAEGRAAYRLGYDVNAGEPGALSIHGRHLLSWRAGALGREPVWG